MGYTKEYWLRHIEYVRGIKPKADDDRSVVQWTRKNVESLLSGNVDGVFGMDGVPVLQGFIEYLDLYHTKEEKDIAINTYKRYLNTIDEYDKPLYKLRAFVDSL